MNIWRRFYTEHRRSVLVVLACALFLAVAALCSLGIGAVPLSARGVWAGLLAGDASTAGRILYHVRLPRLFAAALAGAGLSASGLIIQTVLTNPLAGPGILGVNAGAGFFVVLCAVFMPYTAWTSPFAAFFGALCTVLLVYGIARKAGATRMTLILSGVAVASLMTAGMNAVIKLFPDVLPGVYDFQVGGFAGLSASLLLPAGLCIAAGLLLAFVFGAELDILGLGESTALSLGLNVTAFRFIFLVLAAVLAGAAVSFAGLLGFVGLIIPHVARLLTAGGSRLLLLVSALFGAGFLIVCDTVARSAFAPFELPVGILISFLGAPFFLWLLLRGRGRRHD
jgi:iron complex transport system permease protein